MNNINQFTFFKNYWEVIKELPNKEEFVIAILEYVFEDKEPKFKGLNKGIWSLIEVPLNVSKRNGKNGKSRTKPNQIEIKSKSNQKQIENKSKKNQESDFATISISSSISTSNSISNNKFIKPSIEEINKYCLERKNGIDAESFYNFYESKGWKVGNQPMKNWKACIITWEKRQGKKIEETPEWFDKDLKNEELTKEENEELDDLLESTLKKIESIGE